MKFFVGHFVIRLKMFQYDPYTGEKPQLPQAGGGFFNFHTQCHAVPAVHTMCIITHVHTLKHTNTEAHVS